MRPWPSLPGWNRRHWRRWLTQTGWRCGQWCHATMPTGLWTSCPRAAPGPSWPPTSAPAGFKASSCECGHGDMSGFCHRVSPLYVSMPGEGGLAAGAGGVWPARVGRWTAAERRAACLVIAPAAHPAGIGTEIAAASGAADSRPDCAESAFEADQFGLVRGVGQGLPISQVQQPQLARYHPAKPQQGQRVELHLEQGLGLEHIPRRGAGLVVHHPDLTGGSHIEPVDVSAEQQGFTVIDIAGAQLRLNQQFASLRLN